MHHCVAFVVVEKAKNVRKGQTNKASKTEKQRQKEKERIVENLSIKHFKNWILSLFMNLNFSPPTYNYIYSYGQSLLWTATFLILCFTEKNMYVEWHEGDSFLFLSE